MWLPTRLDTRARQKGGAAGRQCSSFITLRLSSVLRPGRKKAARNAPKCHSSCLCRAGVFVFVVARQIQDMSEVSITHTTVGICLPRLWCGAIGLVCFGPADHPKRVSFFILPFVHGGVAAGRSGVFESAMKTEPRPNRVKYDSKKAAEAARP
jgi:hypothetical protein